MSFPRYPAYKDSGVAWLGEVPEGWDIVRGRRIFENRRENAQPHAEQLAATQAYGVIPQKDFMAKQDQKVVLALSGTESFRDVGIGDFVISLRSFQGGIEYSGYNGCVSPAYTVLRPIPKAKINPDFFRFLLKSLGYIEALQSLTSGIREGRTITYEQFGTLCVPLVPYEEQTQIARFLDHETARIDALIQEQQRLITLLKEKRQAVISHAVTKGLDPTVPMKDSGVEWLGEVPAHWEVTRAKFVSRVFVPQRNKPELNEFSGVPWITMENLNGTDVVASSRMVGEDQLLAAGSKVLPKGAVIASCVGRFGISAVNGFDAVINQQLQAFVPVSIRAEYLCEIVRLSKQYFEMIGTSATLVYVNQQGFEEMPVVLPRSTEQEAICDFVDIEFTRYEHLLSVATQSIHLLQERRAALISAAVTGKMDVRGWRPPGGEGGPGGAGVTTSTPESFADKSYQESVHG